MSLAIDPAKVVRVLLADGWYKCAEGSFDLGSYEFTNKEGDWDFAIFTGDDTLGPSMGFAFITSAAREISGPITSILAVETL